MRMLSLSLGLLVTIAPAATLAGHPAGPAVMKRGPATVTVTLVRWPFT